MPLAIVGAGRLGTAIASALSGAGVAISGPHGRGYTGSGDTGSSGTGSGDDAAVLLCVPDDAITTAAAAIAQGILVGHCSGVSGLGVLGDREGFSVHPLMTVTRDGADFDGVWAAVSGSSPGALDVARSLAQVLGMHPVHVAETDRAAYHAAASIAANFLVTVESAAAELMSTVGLPRKVLLPLARAALENWGRTGPAALTGPVARGDHTTVERQRAEVSSRIPELTELFDALVRATARLAASHPPGGGIGSDATGILPLSDNVESLRTMRTVRTVRELRAALRPFRAGGSVGLVPTMGALHEGHLELARRARADNDAVVMSIFVNPTQFDDPADLDAYPKDEQADADMAAAAGVDFLFMPAAGEVYPPGFSATVALHGPIVDTLEGDRRGVGHFRGVTTVVSKLLGMAQPDRAYFGQKDAQQARVVRALVADLNITTEIVTVPTVREPDGLAMSSRNRRLSPADRARAAGVSAALRAAEAAVEAGERDAAAVLLVADQVLRRNGMTAEYLALVNAETFIAVSTLDAEPALMAVAADLGGTRLIDNIVLNAAV